VTETETTQSALQNAHSANEWTIQAAECAKRAAQAAEIAEAAANMAQGHASNATGLRCRVQIRIGNKRIVYSSNAHASEALAAAYAHCHFGAYAAAGEKVSITAHAAPQKGEEP